MENASQALLITGGIFLALLTLSLLVLMFANINTIGDAQKAQQEARQIQEWNAEWEAYNKHYLYGADVLTLINKAEKNNSEYNNEEEYAVSVKVFEKNGTQINKNYIENNKMSIYKCTKMLFNDETRRINYIEFEFVK